MPTTTTRRARRTRTKRKRVGRAPRFRAMITPEEKKSLIDQIDARHDEVLQQLDQLNLEVELVLKQCAAEGDKTQKSVG